MVLLDRHLEKKLDSLLLISEDYLATVPHRLMTRVILPSSPTPRPAPRVSKP